MFKINALIMALSLSISTLYCSENPNHSKNMVFVSRSIGTDGKPITIVKKLETHSENHSHNSKSTVLVSRSLDKNGKIIVTVKRPKEQSVNNKPFPITFKQSHFNEKTQKEETYEITVLRQNDSSCRQIPTKKVFYQKNFNLKTQQNELSQIIKPPYNNN
jgi:hypothetical protein